MSMCAVFHQFTPAELYIGITEPINTVADNASEAPATGYAFLDLFLANLHRHGMHTANYHAALLDIKKIEFCFTLQTLTGMTFTDFTEAYILLMATDMLKAPNKDLKLVSKRLGFGSYSGFYRFMMRKGMGKPSWL